MTDALDRLTIARQTREGARRHRGWRWLFVGLLLALVAGVLLYRRPLPVKVVSVTPLYPAQALAEVNATGYVVAQRRAAVATKATGRLAWIGVREGDAVKAGQLVARLENEDVSAALDEARALVAVARANLRQAEAEALDAAAARQRSADLLTQAFIASSAHDQAQARDRQARAAVAARRAAVQQAEAAEVAARVALDNTLIRAPFAGVVILKHADEGDVVAPFSSGANSKGAVVTIADLSTLEVEADVSEASLARVKLGQPCEIRLDALPSLRLAGRVKSLVPSVDRAKATVTFKIAFRQIDPRILPDMSAKVAFLARELTANEQSPRLVLPPQAIVRQAGQTQVWLLRGNRVTLQPVRVGPQLGDQVTLLGGLALNDRVVLPVAGLKIDKTVEIQP